MIQIKSHLESRLHSEIDCYWQKSSSDCCVLANIYEGVFIRDGTQLKSAYCSSRNQLKIFRHIFIITLYSVYVFGLLSSVVSCALCFIYLRRQTYIVQWTIFGRSWLDSTLHLPNLTLHCMKPPVVGQQWSTVGVRTPPLVVHDRVPLSTCPSLMNHGQASFTQLECFL